jgi:hypothetical protein
MSGVADYCMLTCYQIAFEVTAGFHVVVVQESLPVSTNRE